MAELQEVSLGELGRRVDRLDTAMVAGFASMREEIQRLAFIPAAVYAADRSADQERIRRVEEDLKEEVDARRTEALTAGQRAWQARLALGLALIGLPLSVIGGLIMAQMK